MRAITERIQRSGAMEVAVLLAVLGLPIGLVSSRVQVFVWTTALIWALLAMATNVLIGWTHILSFGQAAYFGAGAYTVALLRGTELPAPVPVLLGALVALALALPFALAAVRTSGVEFAVLTLVFAMVLWLLTFRVGFLGGDDGISRIPRGSILGLALGDDHRTWWYVLVMVGIAFFLLRRLHRSSLGAAFTAVKDDPIGAAALGMPVRRLQVAAFSIGGLFAGFAGGLYAQVQGVVSPSLLFWVVSGNALLMCVLGGIHRFWGPALGGIVFTWLFFVVIERASTPILYIGLVLVIVVVLLPKGLVGVVEDAAKLVRRRTSGEDPPAAGDAGSAAGGRFASQGVGRSTDVDQEGTS